MFDISIIVTVYNHKRYIEKAINSILMQKGKYTYEVLIGEDCSTDGTRQVLKNIEPSLPNNFKIFYRQKNMGRAGKNNLNDLYARSNGRYIILLEGDDYWIYEYKLQQQLDFLEANKDYLAIAHNTLVVDENGNALEEYYPECKKSEYTIWDFREKLLPGQTTTILKRNYYKLNLFDINLQDNNYPGDRKNAFLLAANGKVACIQEQWSAYRHVTSHGSSFSARLKRQRENGQIDYHTTRLYYKSIYDYSMNHILPPSVLKVTEQLYISLMLKYAICHRDGVSWFELFRELGKTQYFFGDMVFFLKNILRKMELT